MDNGGASRSIDRYGGLVLVVVFLVLLAGRFTLDRLGDLPSWDLRWAGLLVVGLLCLIWATVARERTGKVGTGAYSCWFLAWVAWMAASTAWAPAGARVLEVLSDLVVLTALVWAGWGAAGRISLRALGALWWWVYAAGWVYLAGALAAGPGVQGRYSAFGGGPNVFVRVMALAILATLVLAATRRKAWVLAGLAPFLGGAVLSGSRGGLLAIGVMFLVGGVPVARRLGRTLRRATGLALVPLVVIAGFFYDPNWVRLAQERFVDQTFTEGYDSGRTDLVVRAMELFDEHLWVGTGLDGFFPLQAPWTAGEYPHNLFAAVAAEGGLVGLLLLSGALVTGFAVSRRSPLDADALGFVLAALIMLAAAQFSGDYYDSRFIWFFLGLAAVAARKGRPPDTSSAAIPPGGSQAGVPLETGTLTAAR